MDIAQAIKKTPNTPGVYIFKNKAGRILYIGKAANLRARLRTYGKSDWKNDMLREASRLEWQELESDIGALIREAELVKKYRPHYNILLRDDKNYFYVAFTREEFPRIFLTHQPTRSETTIPSNYIGPFTEGEPLRRVLHILRKTFPYCTCRQQTPRHKRKCVNAEIGKCLGFCCANILYTQKDRAHYRANITAIRKVLTGKSKTLERSLLKRMASFAHKKQYEEAALIRNQIASLHRIFQHSPYIKKDIATEREKALHSLQDALRLPHAPERIECYDISHHQGDSSVASMVVFEHGMPAKDQYRKFIIKHVAGINDPAMMQEVLTRRMRHTEWPFPHLIIVDGGKTQLGAALLAIRGRVPVVAIAKREEELYMPRTKHPLPLKTMPPPLLHLITHARDEAHRFAVTFHRKRKRRLAVNS